MSFREHLYPAKIGLVLAIGSILLYFLFNLWPLAFSVGMAFTNASEQNLFVNPEVISRIDDTIACIERLRSEIGSNPQYAIDFEKFVALELQALDRVINKSQYLIQLVNKTENLTGNFEYYLEANNLYSSALQLQLVPSRVKETLNCHELGYKNAREIVEEQLLKDLDSIIQATSRVVSITNKDEAIKLLKSINVKASEVKSALESLRDLNDYLHKVENSLRDERGRYELRFIGLANFQKLLGDPRFYYSLYKTLLFVATSVPLKVSVGFLLAMFYSTPLIYGRRILRGLMLAPWAIPILLSGLTWQFMVLKGPLAEPLCKIFGVTTETGVLNSEFGAFLVYNLFETWLAYPFIMTVTMGALSSISRDVIEAAYIDGASVLTRLRRVVLPQIARPLITATILTTGASLQAFMVPLLINGGGPTQPITVPLVGTRVGNVNEFVILFGYNRAMIDKDWGYAAASYLVIVIIIMIYVTVWMMYLRKSKR